jgi:hypothetical protein
MDYTEERALAFRREFSRRRGRNLAVVLPCAALIIAFAMGGGALGFTGNARLVPPLVLALIVVGVSMRYWRCPACDGYLGKALNPVACRHCDFTLRTS